MPANITKMSPNGQEANAAAPSSGQTTRSHVDLLKDSVGDAMKRGTSDIADSAYAARESFSDDVSKLKVDLARLQETVSKFATDTGSSVASTARNVGETVVSEAGSAASEITANATAQAKSIASDLESMARRNPLGTLVGALAVGILLGMMTRGRA